MQADQIITFGEQCAQTDCSCLPVQGGKRVFSSGVNVSVNVDVVGTSPVVTELSAPDWAAITKNESIITISGTATPGLHTLVYEVENDCSKECLIVEITVTVGCASLTNIVKNIAISEISTSVTIDIPLPISSTLVSHNLPFNPQVYGTNLVINGAFSEPFQPTYLINLSSECGAYTVSGDIAVCVKPKLFGNSGSTVFEKDVYAEFNWIIEGDFASLQDKSVLPNGMVWDVIPNTPAGKTTIRVSGTPTEDTGSDKLVATVKGLCGTLKLEKTYVQAPCRAIQFVSESGSSQMVLGQPVNFCKTVKGYLPTISAYENIPLGLTASLVPAATEGEWIVCLTGTPVIDPCVKSSGGQICDCATVTLTNQCGEYELKFCFNLNIETVNRPGYCVGVYKLTQTSAPGSPAVHDLEIWGVTPDSTVSIILTDNSTDSLTVDSFGYGKKTISSTAIGCLRISHPSCAMVQMGELSIYCIVDNPGGI